MATQPRYSPFEQIINKSKDAARNLENSSRLAHSFGVYQTIGWGEFSDENRIEFEAPYLNRPSVSYGCSLLDDDESEELRVTRFPRSGGMVKRWDRTAHGLYTGAWVIVWVEDRSPFMAPTVPDPDVSYTIVHDFTFLGVATKDLPATLNGNTNGAF